MRESPFSHFSFEKRQERAAFPSFFPVPQHLFPVLHRKGKNERLLCLRAHAVGKRERRLLPRRGARHRLAAGRRRTRKFFLFAAGDKGLRKFPVVAVKAFFPAALPARLRQQKVGGENGNALPLPLFFLRKIFPQC